MNLFKLLLSNATCAPIIQGANPKSFIRRKDSSDNYLTFNGQKITLTAGA